MSRRDSDEVTFNDVAAYFSEEEWKLLHEWQRTFYRNVMKEIHQALISLGPLIAAVFSLRAKEKEELCPWDNKYSEGIHRSEPSPSGVMANPDVLLQIHREENLHLNNPQSSKERERSDSLSTEFPFLNTDICLRKEEEPASILSNCLGAEIGESGTDCNSGLEVVSFCLKDGYGTYSMDHQDSKKIESISDPIAAGPVITSVYSLRHRSEEVPFQKVLGTEEKNTGDGSMNINRKDGESVTCSKVTTLFKDHSEKAKAKVIQSSEKGIKCGSQLWSESNQELGGENVTRCERVFCNPALTNLHQGTHNMERSAKHNTFESNLSNAKTPTCPSNTQQYTSTECGESFRQMIGSKGYHQAHNNPEREKPYQCTECHKSFHQKGSLLAHHRVHTGKETYQCTKCEKRYSTNEHLVNHQRSHTGEKHNTDCDQSLVQKGNPMVDVSHNEKRKSTECDKSLFQKDKQMTHIITLNEERPYRCMECGKRFHQKGGLVAHHRTHTGEKPFQCPECEKSFSMKANLKVHIKRKHNKQQKY